MFNNQGFPTLSRLEFKVLDLLIEKGIALESYGMELVQNSKGMLKRGSVYVTLGRMEDKGYITSRKEDIRPSHRGLPRRLYKITGTGQQMYDAYSTFTNIQLKGV